MDLLERTKKICKLYDIWPSRSKGQNFLITESIYDKIVAAADLSKDDIVLEVGPGLGFLTAKLAKAAKRVIAVELDDKLAAYLRDAISAGDVSNVEIVNENILDVQVVEFFSKFQIPNSKFRIVANLPYNITSVFLRKFLSNEPRPESMVLMLQKEVAQRICAKPGDMSLLALSVQFYADPEIIEIVPKNNFWPAPKVDSAIIKIRVKREERKDVEEKNFFRLAKFGFSAKRKMLKNNLAGGLRIKPAEAEAILVKAGFNPKIRAEDLGVGDWRKIVEQRT
ncbi:MAG: 16S rRNA (adenine(1518)-N(6)/adenine(1519)-N(6))-dimethyltransferase RsmA [Patescibacteria group bacterium]|nr:16S rRNA (adenine(1518)-N(6)/adenine(1519)-N(6))-dimethyltransferase RsmA [Patescibacteria group bacterium]